jgi:hypothetical protein
MRGEETDAVERGQDIIRTLMTWPAYAKPTVRWARPDDFRAGGVLPMRDEITGQLTPPVFPFDWDVELPHTFVVLPEGLSLSWLLMGRLLGVQQIPANNRTALAKARGYAHIAELPLVSLALLLYPAAEQFTCDDHTRIMTNMEDLAAQMVSKNILGFERLMRSTAPIDKPHQTLLFMNDARNHMIQDIVMSHVSDPDIVELAGKWGVLALGRDNAELETGLIAKSTPFDLLLNQTFRLRIHFARLCGGMAWRHINLDPTRTRFTRGNLGASVTVHQFKGKEPVDRYVFNDLDGQRHYSCGFGDEVVPYGSRAEATVARKRKNVLAALARVQGIVEAAASEGPPYVHPPGFPWGIAVFYRTSVSEMTGRGKKSKTQGKPYTDDNFVKTSFAHRVVVTIPAPVSRQLVDSVLVILRTSGLAVGVFCG